MNSETTDTKDNCQNDSAQSCCGGGCSKSTTKPDWNAIISQAKSIMTDPTNCWTQIKTRLPSIREIYTSYLIPLMVVGLACQIIGNILFSSNGGLFASIIPPIVMAAMTLALLFVNGAIFKFLAPHFGGKCDDNSSFALVGYSSTASILGGYISTLPYFAILGSLFSLYGIYILYQGVTPMTGVTEKRLPYTIVSFVAVVVVNMILGMVILSSLGLAAIQSSGVLTR